MIMNNSICRFCLKKDPFLIDIFSKDYDEMFEISIVIATHFSECSVGQCQEEEEEVSSQSKYICSGCWNKIKEFHIFYCYVNAQQLTLREPKIEIVGNEIKSAVDNIPRENVDTNRQNENKTSGLFYDSDDQYSEQFKLSVSSDDDEDDDLPLRKLFKSKTQEKDTSGSKVKTRKEKKINAASSKINNEIEGNMTPENHELIKIYFDFKCDLCPTVFGDTTLVEAFEHYELVHKTDGYLKCCEKKFYGFERLLEHINTHPIPNIGYDKDTKTPTSKKDNSTDILEEKSESSTSTGSYPAQSPVDSDNYDSNTITFSIFSEDEEDDLPLSKLINTVVEKEIPLGNKVAPGNQKQQKEIKTINTYTKRILKQMKKNHELIKLHFNLKCDLCPTVFGDTTIIEAVSHYALVHKTRGYLKCFHCPKKYYRSGRLLDHIKTHTHPKLRCDKCTITFTSKFTLQNHNYYKHAPIERLIYKCEQCPKSYSRKSYLKYHQISHILKVNQFICDVCNRRYQSVGDLQTHKKIHGNMEVICGICAKIFKNQYILKKHIKDQHGINPSREQCDICQKWICSKSALITHKMRMHTTSTETVKCHICGKTISNKTYLKYHISYTHGPKLHKCTFCDKSFRQFGSLQDHIGVHTGKKTLHSCNFCQKPFKTRNGCNLHRKNKHSAELAKELASIQNSVQENYAKEKAILIDSTFGEQ